MVQPATGLRLVIVPLRRWQPMARLIEGAEADALDCSGPALHKVIVSRRDGVEGLLEVRCILRVLLGLGLRRREGMFVVLQEIPDFAGMRVVFEDRAKVDLLPECGLEGLRDELQTAEIVGF